MNIGWARLSMSIELDFNIAKSGFSQERCPIIRNLMKRGHNITLYTPISKKEEKNIESIKAGNISELWDNSHISDISYEPTGLPDINCDILIVESGALNFGFFDKFNDTPQIRRMSNIIDAHKGLVILLQNDPDLPFPFYKLAGCERDWNHEENPYRLGSGTIKECTNLEDYGWATYDEIFKDKKWIVLTKSANEELVWEAFDTSRARFKSFDNELTLKFLPTPQTSEFVNKFEVCEKPEYDIFCPGYPRNREKSFESLFLQFVKYYNLVSCGLWGRAKNFDYKTDCIELGMKCLGFIDNYLDMYKAINNSNTVIHLGVGKTRKLGWITGRYIEGIFCKSIAFYDDNMIGYDNYIDYRFGVNKENAYEKYKWISKLTHDQRRKLWAYQYDLVKTYTIANFVDNLEKIWIETGIDNKVDEEKIKKYSHIYNEELVDHNIEYTQDEIDGIFNLLGQKATIKNKRMMKKLLKKLRKPKIEIITMVEPEVEPEVPIIEEIMSDIKVPAELALPVEQKDEILVKKEIPAEIEAILTKLGIEKRDGLKIYIKETFICY